MDNLYLVSKDMANLIDPETGEIADYEAFEALQLRKEQLVSEMGNAFLNICAEGDAIDEAIKRLEGLKQKNMAKQQKMMDHLRQATGEENYKTPFITIQFRQTKATIIDDKDAIPEEYITTKTTVTKNPNKDAIKKAIESGVEVPGAHVEYYKSMSVK